MILSKNDLRRINESRRDFLKNCTINLKNEIAKFEYDIAELKHEFNSLTCNDKKDAARFLINKFKFSNRRACELVGLGRNTLRYKSKKKK